MSGRKRRDEAGIALISVLCLILSLSAVTAALVATSRLTTLNIRSFNTFMRSTYQAEGALARIGYLLAADTITHANERELGEIDYAAFDNQRYLPDGTIREIDYYGTPVRYQIFDANRGWDFSPSGYADTVATLQQAPDADDTLDADELQQLADRIADYIDTDDDVAANGGEVGEYRDRELAPLPRNGPMQFREELLYVEGFRKLIPTDRFGLLSAVRLMPPDGLAEFSGNPSIFSADRLQLKVVGGFDDAQADEVLAALEKYRNEGTRLSETLDATLLATLRQSFGTGESGVYTVNILRAGTPGQPAARLTASFEAIPASGPEEGVLKYLEFLRY